MAALACLSRVRARAQWQQRRGSSSTLAAVAEHSAVAVAEEVRAPPNDRRSYRVLDMANGMQVLLASDPEADMAAAALSVRCGTFQDPAKRLGLAHFHEHMLFLGTEKYPDEDEYNRYLNEHGGNSNAFTMNEYTTYYFKVAAPHFDGALDRFAQFFVAPTFDDSCVEREMRAVDSESTNYSTEDGWRLQQVLKATSAQDHPFFRFDVGNLDTLGADDLPGTRAELVAWNQEHYQAGAMKLVVVGADDLETLEKTAVAQFGPVRRGSGKTPAYPCQAWPQERLGRVISCVPIKEARSISVCWPLPPQTEHLFAKPELYISHVLGHEGEGSLHEILNQRGWVDQLSAGPSQAWTDSQLFSLNVSLTPDGDVNRDEVLALLFEYVKLICEAGPQEATFKELAALQEISFAHKEDAPAPDDFAASAAMTLHKYPAREVIRGPFAVDDWRPDVVEEYFAMLRPESCLVFITSSDFEAEAAEALAGAGAEVQAGEGAWQKERWYGAPFREEPFSESLLAKWRVPKEEVEALGLQLPCPNPFIPQDFSLRGAIKDGEVSAAETSRSPTEVLPPTLLLSEPMMRLWHKTDRAFSSPREYVLAQVHLPAYERGPEVVAMLRLFCNIIYDDLNAYAYDASVAGLGYGLDFSDSLSFSVAGFSDKLPILMEVVLQRVREVLKDIESGEAGSERATELMEKLDTQRQILLQDYRNFTREEPYSVCTYYASQLMLRNSWHLSEYIDVLDQPVSLASLAAAVRPAFQEAQLEVFVHGNASADEARDAAKALLAALRDLGAAAPADVRRKEVTRLPAGDSNATVFEFDLAAENPQQENCCTETIFEVGPVAEDPHRNACLSIVSHVASTSAYDRLRTKEQLGYIVQAGGWGEQHVNGFCVLVQGNRLPPKDVDLRIEAWLERFGTELEDMKEEDFANNVSAVVSQLTERYARLSQETSRHWAEIQPRHYRFDRIAKCVEALRSLSKGDVVRFFNEYLAAAAPSRRKLSVRVLGTSAEGARSEEQGLLSTLADIRAFQAAASAEEIFLAPEPAELLPMAVEA